MRRVGRRPDAWRRSAAQQAAQPTVNPENIWTRIYNVTNARAQAWSRKHKGNKLNNVSWLALWERVRDELAPSAGWAVERRRSYAAVTTWGEEVRV